MDRHLHQRMAHEFPAPLTRRRSDARIDLDHLGIDRKRRADGVAVEGLEEAPHADAHAVFMPAPIRDIWLHGDSGRRWQYLPRHRPLDLPDFEIDHWPEDESQAVGQLERRSIDDGGIASTL